MNKKIILRTISILFSIYAKIVFTGTVDEFNKLLKIAAEYENPAHIEIGENKLGVIGDIHGSLYNLKSILDIIDASEETNFTIPEDLHIVFLGDYINGENRNIEVIETICKLKRANPQRIHFIRGNHDSKKDMLRRKKERSSGNSRITGTLLIEELENKISEEETENPKETLRKILNSFEKFFSKMASRIEFSLQDKKILAFHGNDVNDMYHVIPDKFMGEATSNKYIKSVSQLLEDTNNPDLIFVGHDHVATGLKVVSLNNMEEIKQGYIQRGLNMEDNRTSQRLFWRIAVNNRESKRLEGIKGVSSVNLSSENQTPVILTCSGSFPSQITEQQPEGTCGNYPTFNVVSIKNGELFCRIFGVENVFIKQTKKIDDITIEYVD